MRVWVVAFGKLKTPGIRDSVDHYLKLLSGFVTVNEVELKPLSVPDKEPATRKQIQAKEAELLWDVIEKKAKTKHAVFLLDEEGKSSATRDWARRVTELENEGFGDLFFCVGGSLGFASELKKKVGLSRLLGFGPQTVSHELARLVLVEQLYRAWGVTRGHPYHNESH